MMIKEQTGVALIEVLVAILILSFGILGTVGLLINSLRLSSSSNYRTIAATQASSMADVIRANPFAISSPGNTLVSFNTVNATQADFGATCFATGGCTRANFLNNNVWAWNQQLANALPQGVGTLCFTSTPGGGTPNACPAVVPGDANAQFIAKVCWNEQRVGVSTAALDANGFLCTWVAI